MLGKLLEMAFLLKNISSRSFLNILTELAVHLYMWYIKVNLSVVSKILFMASDVKLLSVNISQLTGTKLPNHSDIFSLKKKLILL